MTYHAVHIVQYRKLLYVIFIRVYVTLYSTVSIGENVIKVRT
uniref:Uncharacterized protein n=1 Tax=Anguilla anguilla TaxID=7936 RepID=A0A0E9PU27_ANGAN